MTTYPYPIWNWRDARYYPSVNKQTDNPSLRVVWAWEFLRRNPRYQQVIDSIDTAVAEGKGSRDELSAEICKDFRLCFSSGYYHPKWDLAETDFVTRADAPPYFLDAKVEGSVPESIESFSQPHYLLTALDLRFPLPPQIEEIKKRASALREGSDLTEDGDGINQSETFPQFRTEFSRYVRLLDAEASGEAELAIAETIFSNQDVDSALDSTRKGIKRAKELRDHHYWLLALGAQGMSMHSLFRT